MQPGGAKKGGLGATKVKTNFADLEQQANFQANQYKESKVPATKKSLEDEEADIASVRLAYKDLSIEAQKHEQKLKHVDSAKAKQMERLGMGFNLRGDVSHSSLTDMKTIAQEPAPKYDSKVYEKEPKDDFFDDYVTMYNQPKQQDRELEMMGFEKIEPIEPRHANISSMFSSNQNNNNQHNNGSENESRNNNKSKSNKLSYNTYENDEAQKKFGTSKAISSEQFFGNEPSSFERSANLAKFQGSNSISSAEYFGNNPNNPSATNRGRKHTNDYNFPSL